MVQPGGGEGNLEGKEPSERSHVSRVSKAALRRRTARLFTASEWFDARGIDSEKPGCQGNEAALAARARTKAGQFISATLAVLKSWGDSRPWLRAPFWASRPSGFWRSRPFGFEAQRLHFSPFNPLLGKVLGRSGCPARR